MKDNSRIPHTCPLIDEVIQHLELIDWDGDVEGISDNNEAVKLMENIRVHNSMLRDWGNEQYNRVDELEREIDEVRLQLKDQKEELDKLKEDNQRLEDLTDYDSEEKVRLEDEVNRLRAVIDRLQ